MSEASINFPGEEKETLKEIRIMPEQVIKKLEYLKTCKMTCSDGTQSGFCRKSQER